MVGSASQVQSSRSAFTLIELIVCLAIAGILASLIIPAVQSVRESARMASCKNHLAQLTIAHSHFHDQYGTFTSTYGMAYGPPAGMAGVARFIEQANAPDGRQHFELVECPSDDQLERFDSPQSYTLNTGSAYLGAGPFRSPRVRLRDVTDGSAYTCCLGEAVSVVAGDDATAAERRVARHVWLIRLSPNPPNGEAELIAQCDRAKSACLTGPRTFFPLSDPEPAGMWGNTNVTHTHFLPLNGRRCRTLDGSRVLPSGWDLPVDWFQQVVSSAHPSGAHISLLDGQVRFIHEQVDPTVWSALGTISGGEAGALP
jgi:prepilin-type N-terminal cleavage/methylation domain-containing protein